jgi:hypothetical protein
MSEFTYLFRGRDLSASPEQMQKTMQKWLTWFKGLEANGHLKDPGHPLEARGAVVRGSFLSGGHRRIATSSRNAKRGCRPLS